MSLYQKTIAYNLDHVSWNFCKSIWMFLCFCFFVVLDFNINCSHGNVQHRCLNTVWYRLKCVLAQWLLLSDVGLGCFGMVLSFSMSILKQMAETVAYYTLYIISNHISLLFCITQLYVYNCCLQAHWASAIFPLYECD